MTGRDSIGMSSGCCIKSLSRSLFVSPVDSSGPILNYSNHDELSIARTLPHTDWGIKTEIRVPAFS